MADDADYDDVNFDVIMNGLDYPVVSAKTKQQLPSRSPLRRSVVTESAGMMRNEAEDDVMMTSQQRRQRLASKHSAIHRRRGENSTGDRHQCLDAGGDDTGLGSGASFDDVGESDDDDADVTPRMTSLPVDLDAATDDGDLAGSEIDMEVCRRRLGLLDGEIGKQIESRFRETMASITGAFRRKSQQDDVDSVQTEDIETEFVKSLVNPDVIAAGLRKSVPIPPMPPVPITQVPQQRLSWSLGSNDNDLDNLDDLSVKTEDFEHQFNRTTTSVVKQLANTPVMTFDPFMIDSDIDTVHSQSVRDTFHSVLARRDQKSSVPCFRRQGGSLPRKTTATRARRVPRDPGVYSDTEADFDEQKYVPPPRRSVRPNLGKLKKSGIRGMADQTRELERKVPPRVPTGRAGTGGVTTRTTRLGSYLALQNKADYEVSCRLKQELVKLQSQIKQAMHSKQAMQQTTEKLQKLAGQHQQGITAAMKQLSETRVMVENARSELKLAEFKRDATSKELECLTAEIDNRRLQLQRLAVEEKMTTENKQPQSTTSDAKSDRSDNMDEELQRLQQTTDELKECNQQLLDEQRSTKQINEQLKQDVQAKEELIHELTVSKDDLDSKLTKAENDCKRMELEKNDFIEKKNAEYEAIKEEIRNELAASRAKSSVEVSELQRHIEELTNQLRVSTEESCSKDELNAQLREDLGRQVDQMQEQSQRQNTILEENVRNLRGIIQEKEAAIVAAEEQGEMGRKMAVEEACQNAKADHQRILQEQKEQFNAELTTLQEQLNAKNLELAEQADRIREQEEWMKHTTERLQQEGYQKMQEAVQAERSRLEAEKEAELSAQLESMKEEMVRNGKQLREELQNERKFASNYKEQLEALQQELEKTRLACRLVYRETFKSPTKEDILSSGQQQMSFDDKHHFQEVAQATHDKLNEVVRKQKEEMERLRRENSELQLQCQERISAMDKFDKKLQDELTDEQEKLSRALGTLKSWSSHKLSTNHGSDVRTALYSTVVSLRKSSEILREKLSQQQKQIEDQLQSVNKTNRKKKKVPTATLR